MCLLSSSLGPELFADLLSWGFPWTHSVLRGHCTCHFCSMVLSELGYLLWDRKWWWWPNVSRYKRREGWDFLGLSGVGASRMAINFPEQQDYFPSSSCSHTPLLKDGFLPSPLLLYDSRIHCCLEHGAWRSPRAMQEQVWGLTLYTGFPITTAWPSLPMWTKYMWLQYIICKYNILTRGCMAKKCRWYRKSWGIKQ